MHFDGNSYSSRLKYLMACGSVVFKQKSDWVEWWSAWAPDYAPLDEEIFVTLEKGGVDAAEKLATMYKASQEPGDNRAVKMAKRAQEFFLRIFNEDYLDCYVKHTLEESAATWGQYSHRPGVPIEDVLINPYKNHEVK